MNNSLLMDNKRSLEIDPATEADHIAGQLKHDLAHVLRRRGAVVGVSGGIDSAVVLGLCARALGPGRVLAVLMPEQESDPQSLRCGQQAARHFGVETVTEDITGALEGFGAYRRRDEAVRRIFPEYDASCRMRIGLPKSTFDQDRLNLFELTIVLPDGTEKTARLPPAEYLAIVAASNFKQRSRMCFLYYHAESRHYAVIGTGNRNECDLGFFVKHGDGGADLMPLRHLFKTQVYQLARHLDVPPEIIDRPPTPDTYTAAHTHEDFFYRAPFAILDAVWNAWEQHVPEEEIARDLDLSTTQVGNIIGDIRRKNKTSEYLRYVPG